MYKKGSQDPTDTPPMDGFVSATELRQVLPTHVDTKLAIAGVVALMVKTVTITCFR